MTEPDPLPESEREVRAYAAESGDPILRRHLTVVLAELDRVKRERDRLKAEKAELRELLTSEREIRWRPQTW